MTDREQKIHQAFLKLQDKEAVEGVRQEVMQVIADLSAGRLRTASRDPEGKWIVHEWIKQAILIYFRLMKMKMIKSGAMSFYDKIPVREWTGKEGVRVVPQALVRQGAYIARGSVLMPSYVNIGAYVDQDTLVDTWATVGSCAQVGKRVHLSGGVGLGGVLEPVQARPVIVEDDVFIGSRAIIVEGVILRRGAVVGAGTILTSSTKIIDTTREGGPVLKGEVPERAVVIPGGTNKSFAGGSFTVPCALILGKRSEKTDSKTSLNEVLRKFNIH